MKKVFVFLKKDWTYKNLHIQKILKKFCAKFFFGFSLSFLFLVVVFRGRGVVGRRYFFPNIKILLQPEDFLFCFF